MDFLPNFFPHSFNTLFFCNLHSYPNPQTLDFKGLQVLIHLSTPPKAEKAESIYINIHKLREKKTLSTCQP